MWVSPANLQIIPRLWLACVVSVDTKCPWLNLFDGCSYLVNEWKKLILEREREKNQRRKQGEWWWQWQQQRWIKMKCTLWYRHRIKGSILARPGTPFGRFGPLSVHFEIDHYNGSDQNFMDPLNFTRHGMSKSFAELLTSKIVIVNTKRLENEQIMTQKTRRSSSSGWQHSTLRTP